MHDYPEPGETDVLQEPPVPLSEDEAGQPPEAGFMNLSELKRRSPTELLEYAEELGIENASTLRKPDLERIPESRIHTALEASLNCEVHIRTI